MSICWVAERNDLSACADTLTKPVVTVMWCTPHSRINFIFKGVGQLKNDISTMILSSIFKGGGAIKE